MKISSGTTYSEPLRCISPLGKIIRPFVSRIWLLLFLLGMTATVRGQVDITPPSGNLIDPGDVIFHHTRGYAVTCAADTAITGVQVQMNLPVTSTLAARIYSNTGTLLGSGTAVNGTGAKAFITAPVSYTLLAGTTYRVCFYVNDPAAVFPRKDSPSFPYTVSGITVSACWSTLGNTDAFPTSSNSWGPIMRLNTGVVLAPEIVVFDGSGTGGAQRTDNTGTHAFGNVTTGGSSTAQTFTIQNTGTANLTLGTVTLSGTDPTQFSVTQPVSTSVAATATTTFTVTFSPTTAGAKSAVVNIASNDADENPFEINVGGTGVAPAPGITFTDAGGGTNNTWSLGYQFLASQALVVSQLGFYDDFSNGLSESHTVGLYETNGTLIASVIVTPSSPLVGGPFRYAAITPVALVAGQSYIIAATTGSEPYASNPPSFATQAGVVFQGDRFVQSTTLAFPTGSTGGVNGWFGPNFLAGPATVTASPEIAVEQPVGTNLTDGSASIAFGTADVGVPVTQTFRIKNTGTGALNLTGITFDGSTPGDFTVTTAPVSPVAATTGQTDFVVTFKPLQSGTRTAVMHIANDDSDENPFDITLTGNGTTFTGGTWTGTPALIDIPPSGSFVATGLNFDTDLGFVPTPNQSYTFINIQGTPPAGIIGTFNDLPEGGVVAMSFNGVIYYFQADYTSGVDNNDLQLTNFAPGTAMWKWLAGPSSRNGVGIYGNINVAAPTNNPGARQGAMNWLGQDGSLWMLGGYGYATAVTNPPRYLNDLWQYDRVQGRWIWRKGNSTPNNFGVYGTVGVEAAANAPGSRHTGTTWTDANGNLWLFGGFGVGTGVGAASLNDLWRFNRATGNWTWMKGSTVTGAAAVRGTLGVAAAANTPGARSSAAGAYSNGFLWLFSGYTGTAYYNDLWRYEIATGNWAWMGGSSTPNQNGAYGTQGTGSTSNIPGARRDATAWAAKDGSLWFFGGLGLPATGTTAGDLSDLWSYNPANGQWTWRKGVNTTGAAGVYGTINTPAPGNQPGARSAGSGWVTVDGDLWLVGGYKDSFLTFNDVWIYDIGTNQWTWKQGAAGTLSVPGVYGTKGQFAASNQPGGRFTPSTWVTLNGSLWIFGGGGADSFGNTGRMSDLWTYAIPVRAGVPYDEEMPADFPDELIVNAAPSVSDATAGTLAYVPVSGQLSGLDTDGDRILFNAAGSTTSSQGTLTLNVDGTWTYTPAYGFTGVASFQFKGADNYGGQSAVKTLVISVIANPADSDGDGIADAFEQSTWGDLATADGDGDADFDGQSNYFEFLAGTDPLDGSETLSTAPTVSGSVTVDGTVQLQLNHVRPGVNYHLETSSDLDAWSRIGTFTFSTAGSATIEDPIPSTAAPKFYRMSLEATPAVMVP